MRFANSHSKIGRQRILLAMRVKKPVEVVGIHCCQDWGTLQVCLNWEIIGLIQFNFNTNGEIRLILPSTETTVRVENWEQLACFMDALAMSFTLEEATAFLQDKIHQDAQLDAVG